MPMSSALMESDHECKEQLVPDDGMFVSDEKAFLAGTVN